MVNKVVPDAEFDDAVRQWVADIAGKSPLLLGMGKRALAATRDLPLDSALDYLQAQLALAFTTDDLSRRGAGLQRKAFATVAQHMRAPDCPAVVQEVSAPFTLTDGDLEAPLPLVGPRQ